MGHRVEPASKRLLVEPIAKGPRGRQAYFLALGLDCRGAWLGAGCHPTVDGTWHWSDPLPFAFRFAFGSQTQNPLGAIGAFLTVRYFSRKVNMEWRHCALQVSNQPLINPLSMLTLTQTCVDVGRSVLLRCLAVRSYSFQGSNV